MDLDRLTGPAAATDDDLLELDDALDRLAKEYPAAAELVKLRFFAGMTLGEAADALGHAPPDRRPALGVRPGLARPTPWPRVTSRKFSDSVAHFGTGRGIGR